MGTLTKNFSVSEFQCKCCGCFIPNQKLIDSLQELRDLVGVPITVNSGYRCLTHNRRVRGSNNSQHRKGAAADIVIEGMTPLEMYAYALEIPTFRQGGIGVYPGQGFIHVDVRGYPARWGKVDGKFVDINEILKTNEGD